MFICTYSQLRVQRNQESATRHLNEFFSPRPNLPLYRLSLDTSRFAYPLYRAHFVGLFLSSPHIPLESFSRAISSSGWHLGSSSDQNTQYPNTTRKPYINPKKKQKKEFYLTNHHAYNAPTSFTTHPLLFAACTIY